jgi:hypothetical protein
MNPYYVTPSDTESDIGNDSASDIIIIEDSESDVGSVMSDDIYSLDSIDIDICEQICHEESAYFYEDRLDKQYYLGTCCRPHRSDQTIQSLSEYWMMSSSISPGTFYRYKLVDTLHYLWLYSIVRTSRSQFEIMQLHIDPENGVYKVVLKTFWLRIVQRTWKRIFRERKEIWRKRMTMGSLRHREIRGRYPTHINSLPGLLGMI